MDKQRYFIYLAYDGSAYCGWQTQPNGITVQACLEESFSLVLREPIEITGAGRTDSGVHAKLMTAHFDSSHLDLNDVFVNKINRLLPKDIALSGIKKVQPDAHARFDALSRTYQYHIATTKNPFNRNYSWKVHHLLNMDLMNKAAAILLDYTDFTSFSKLHTDVKTNNCKIEFAKWEKSGNECIFTIQANRFLRNMVRAIVGTLVDVGKEKITPEQFRQIIDNKDRSKAGESAPAQGLFLVDVAYDEKKIMTQE